MQKMSLVKLLDGIDSEIIGDPDLNVELFTDNSRKVGRGGLFIAVKGLTHDGHDFIDQAIKNGALVVIGGIKPKNKWLSKATYVKVNNTRRALGLISSNWFDNPSRKLKVIGVTGTDGKTTTASIIYQIFEFCDKKAGLVTTVSAKIGNEEYDTGFHVTNPDPISLQSFLARMVKAKCEYAVVEVTSHGIHQGRISGIDFDTAVLTNITNEHLDYHKSFKRYVETKSKLFGLAKSAVILNLDDKSFNTIKSKVNKKAKLLTYSLTKESADLSASELKETKTGLEFDLNVQGRSLHATTPINGEFNVYNSLAAIATCVSLGLKPANVVKSLEKLKLPKGRLQKIKNERGLKIIIDYAHTPNAVENVLKALKKQLGGGRLITIVSAEGERDPGKRFDIPEVAAQIADVTILNPIDVRSEDPNHILIEMEKGAKKAGGVFESFIDRKKAIDFAINKVAKKGDTVLILGKGHETGMDYGDHEAPWSDEKVVKKALYKK